MELYRKLFSIKRNLTRWYYIKIYAPTWLHLLSTITDKLILVQLLLVGTSDLGCKLADF